ncbi:hypothetical protein PP175_26305 (plasmid) [Aneurinibacillus sp. Ricciae_BoGa-3]|uniref:hypothetical protein n=1 Tax=Aneurinibacillus sp. Ricciae_BoGa-3 TaxID=3022697 RepID=UPI0023426B79|nr:hypothetical protein [Aneurinibacillus sp. Ricciae_BoGa-3]WCK57580.1 hypothetical protein PP175_26305 [Aneurinibacillus sp. Ricciae_BoGa-3]
MWNKRSNGGHVTRKKVKIKLFGMHFAWIQHNLLETFAENSGVSNRTEWLKEKVKEEFGIQLEKKADLLLLDYLVRDNYYVDKTDWLREKMRQEIRRVRNEV